MKISLTGWILALSLSLLGLGKQWKERVLMLPLQKSVLNKAHADSSTLIRVKK